jgi:hypothetical protein
MVYLRRATPWRSVALFAVLFALFFGVLEAADQDFDSELESQQRGGYPKKPYAQNQAILQVSSVTFDGNATRTSTAGVALFERAYSKSRARFCSMLLCTLV